MLRENLKIAINKSGLIVKEIASKSGVKKRTIDKWVGLEKIQPRVIDLFKVCKTLGITIEWVIAGEEGQDYVRNIVQKEGQ